MRKLTIFTAILLNSFFSACGFYPYGEDIRFQFLNPDHFPFQAYASFYYSSLSFEQSPETINSNRDNEKLWKAYCNNKIAIEDVSTVLESYTFSDIREDSPNPFLHYLYSKKDVVAVTYLKFAKNCEYFNTWQDDPWERNERTSIPKRNSLLNKAIVLAAGKSNPYFKKRYAFLALRLAFYNHNTKAIDTLYDRYFTISGTSDVIDVWALYFKAISEKDPALQNLYFAKVFAASPEKRFVSWQNFSSKIPVGNVLKATRNRKEKAEVLLLYGLYNPDKNLDNMRRIYVEYPESDGLSFLLYRELGKLENWIFTPYYSLFSSSLENYRANNYSENRNVLQVLERSETDRHYAAEVLRFIDSVDLSKVKNADFWKYARAELLFMTRKYRESLRLISELERNLPVQDPMRNNVEIIKTLDLFAGQTYGKAEIPEAAKSIIMKNKDHKQFIFALGRELEYLGNSDDAALLYASLIRSKEDYSQVYFKSLKNNNKTFGTYYYNYFDYLDAIYSPGQLKSFIRALEGLGKSTDPFYRNFYTVKPSEINSLYDLLGTKYIRQNKLSSALKVFSKLGEDYFDTEYSHWEKGGKDSYSSSQITFDKNPFYHLKYTPGFIPEKEHFKVNKISITRKLIEYLGRANNPEEKDRDYYYFLVANCYYNMSQYGNAWMMKRYFLSSLGNFSIREDNREFNTAGLAKFYYGKALGNARTDRFKALCLRMQGRCENYHYDFTAGADHNDSSPSYNDGNRRLQANRYYQDLKSKFPRQYEDMISGCEFFNAYFKARR